MTINHFNNRITSPLISITTGYVYIVVLSTFLYIAGFYEHSTFFTFGPPIIFMGTPIENNIIYYSLLLLFFIHQLINNWINDVTYPWILNCVQDPKSTNLVYGKKTSMLIVNMFALYSQLDVVLIIAGVMSQLTFFIILIIANMVSVSVINWQYIKHKNDPLDDLENGLLNDII